MSDKDPSYWDTMFQALGQLSPGWQGALMAFVLSVLRLIYEGKEQRWQRIFIESLICGALTLSASAVIDWAGMPHSMTTAAGGAIGFIGVVKLRQMALKYLNIRITDHHE